MVLISLIWTYTFCAPSEFSRKLVLLGYIAICLGFGTGYQAYMIMNGKAVDYMCRQADLEQDCKLESKNLLLVDFVLKTIFNIYITFVLMKWSKHEDGYNKQNRIFPKTKLYTIVIT